MKQDKSEELRQFNLGLTRGRELGREEATEKVKQIVASLSAFVDVIQLQLSNIGKGV